ncbi:hypothetical protein B566_EDAN016900 [Ephemera danica]|nr:hypothetical protein B566_EDAN016900 [Ephemera danica]
MPNTPLIRIVGDNICTSSDYRLMIDQRVVGHAASFVEASMRNGNDPRGR